MIRLLCLLPGLLLVGCIQREPTLYRWGAFPDQQYQYLLHEGVSVDEQIRTLEAEAERTNAEQADLPPGFRAHLGLLYLDAGNPARARELWLAEKVAFPESAPFLDHQLLNKLDAAPKTEGQAP